jgi:gas vesicle protein
MIDPAFMDFVQTLMLVAVGGGMGANEVIKRRRLKKNGDSKDYGPVVQAELNGNLGHMENRIMDSLQEVKDGVQEIRQDAKQHYKDDAERFDDFGQRISSIEGRFLGRKL